jgi:nucleoid DNA-binding protein
MSLNKQKMVRETGRRTRLSNRDVQSVIETLVEVWTEELVNGGHIELEGFFKLNVQKIERRHPVTKQMRAFPRLRTTTGNRLRSWLQAALDNDKFL